MEKIGCIVTLPALSKSFPKGVVAKPLDQAESNVNAGMPQVVNIIGIPNAVDINVVIVAPAGWPSLIEHEPIATGL
jgi:hypothetical protein